MKKKTGNNQSDLEYKISPKGSLGLLALGDIGLEAWRKVRHQSHIEEKNNEK